MYCITQPCFTLALFTRNLITSSTFVKLRLTCMISCSQSVYNKGDFQRSLFFCISDFVIKPKHGETNKISRFIQLKTVVYFWEVVFPSLRVYRSSAEKTLSLPCCNNNLVLFTMQYFIGTRL